MVQCLLRPWQFLPKADTLRRKFMESFYILSFCLGKIGGFDMAAKLERDFQAKKQQKKKPTSYRHELFVVNQLFIKYAATNGQN